MRGAVETCNLILNASQQDPTWAESIKTAPVADISLQYPLQLLGHIANEQPWPQEPRRTKVDKRNPLRHEITDSPFWTLYGGRGQRPEVHMLSAYEFASHFYIKQARHPYSLRRQEEDPDSFEARLTPDGIEKVSKNSKKLVAGLDYVIKEDGGEGWLPLGQGRMVQAYRHDWVIAARRRPYVPVIFGAQSSRTKEEQAMRILVLYFPWVNDPADGSSQVPFINDMWQPGVSDWKQALLSHAANVGFLTEEVKRLVMSFVFTYCLPRQTRLVDGLEENSDNEDVEDDLVDFTLGGDDLLQATLTHVRGSGRREQATEINSCSDVDVDGGEGALAEQADPTRLYDMTMELFGLSDAIWQREGKTSDPEANRRYEQLLKQVAAGDPFDHDTAKAAARASSKAGENASQTGKSGLIGRVDAEVEAGRRGGAS